MNDITDRKGEARRAAFARRASAHAALRQAASAALLDYCADLSERVVAGYLPIRTEADPLPAMTELARQNRICVPVVEGAGKPLSFREWRPGCALEEGPFNVLVPVGTAVLVPDLLIVPLVAFDAAGYRLGYGGGFYDRTLERLRNAGPVLALGFAYSAQGVERLPVEDTDQPLDEIVTELGPASRLGRDAQPMI